VEQMCDAKDDLVMPCNFNLRHKNESNLLKTGGNKDRGGDRVEPFVEIPSERRSSKSNLIRSLFKPWFPVRLQKRPPFRALILSQRTPICVGSLGRVRGQVEFFRKIRHAPLATAATRTPYVIYLENRSKISKVDRKRRLRRNT
jgi:hypothetical protein